MYGGGETRQLQEIHSRKVEDYVRVVHESWSSSPSYTVNDSAEVQDAVKSSEAVRQFWDLVVITCQDEEQASHYVAEIKSRLKLRLLPCAARYYVIPDSTAQKDSKASVRLGNGGSTFSTLHWLDSKFGAKLDERASVKVLIIHSGGWSQRLPHTSASGKLFVSLPFSLPGRKTSTSMLEMKLIMLVDVPGAMEGSGVVCTCADDIQLFESADLSLPPSGFWAFAHPSQRELGLTHGVFVLDEEEVEACGSPEEASQKNFKVAQFLHKPSFKEMDEAGIGCTFLSQFDGKGDIFIDSTFGFSWPTARKFVDFYADNSPLQCELDMYGDVLRAMGSASSDYYIEKNNSVIVAHPLHTAMRKLLFDLVQDVDFVAVPLVPSTWDHIGTLTEYLEHYCVTLPRYGFERSVSSPKLTSAAEEEERAAEHKRRFSDSASSIRSVTPPPEPEGDAKLLQSSMDGVMEVSAAACELHSILGPDARLGSGCVVEYCAFLAAVTIQSGCVLSNISLTKPCVIPANTFMQTIPVQLAKAGPVQYVTALLPTKADIKRQIEVGEESGYHVTADVTMQDVMDGLGVSAAEVWPAGAGNLSVLRSLWNACLFEVHDTREKATRAALRLLGLYHGRDIVGKGEVAGEEKEKTVRISMVQALQSKNMKEFRRLREEHDQAVVTAQFSSMFFNEVDVMAWEDRVPFIRWLAGSPSAACGDLRGSLKDISVSYCEPGPETVSKMKEFALGNGVAALEDDQHAEFVCSSIQRLFKDTYEKIKDDPLVLHRLCFSVGCLCARLSVANDSMRERLRRLSLENMENGKKALMEGILLGLVPMSPLPSLSSYPSHGSAALPFFSALRGIMGDTYASPCPLALSASAECHLPIRINLAGAWTDTPPYALEVGGAVVNCALSLEDSMPVKVYARVIDEPVIRLRSADQHVEEALDDAAVIGACEKVGVDTTLGLHKAVVALMLFPWWIPGSDAQLVGEGKERKEYARAIRESLFGQGRGMELFTDVTCIPKGTGLGTSSILFLACVVAVMKLLVPTATTTHLKDADVKRRFLDFTWNSVLALEQILGSCGGWQDQLGGGTPGIKLVTTRAGLVPEYDIKTVALDKEHEALFNERLVAIYSGPREKTAQQVLFSISEHWATRSFDVPNTLHEIYDHAVGLFPLLQEFESTPVAEKEAIEEVLSRLGSRLSGAKSLAEKLERKTTTQWLEELTSAALKFCSGCNAMGAGSGGFLIGYLREGMSKEEMKEHFQEHYPTTKFYSFKLCTEELL